MPGHVKLMIHAPITKSQAIAQRDKGSVYINQYFNELNTEAHFRTTGPEIWKQTSGQITIWWQQVEQEVRFQVLDDI